MSATDTLRTARTLTEAGVPDRQADAHARALDEAVGDLVTREHLDMTLRADLEALERRLTVSLYRALLIQTAAILGAMIALLRLLP